MAWLAVDEDGCEWGFKVKPHRDNDGNGIFQPSCTDDRYMEFPKGTVEKIIGRKITWDDSAVEIT